MAVELKQFGSLFFLGSSTETVRYPYALVKSPSVRVCVPNG